ncbi:hypothetical protein D9M73_270550 [compost metagenome]
MAPTIALEALDNARQQPAAANRKHHRIRHELPGPGHFVDQGGVPLPQQRVVEGMQEGIIGRQQ